MALATGQPIMVAAYALYKAGFRGQRLVNQLAIDGRESDYDPDAENLTYPDHSEGYGQINQLAHHGRFGTDAQLKEPFRNAVAQWELSRGGRDLSPWKGPSGSWMDGITPAMFAAARRAAAAVTGGATPAGRLRAPAAAAPAAGGQAGQSQQRAALISQYLSNQHDPDALISLATGLQATPTVPKVKAVPKPSTSTTTAATGGRWGNPSDVYELFYDPLGGVKHGTEIGAIGNHTDHDHFASDPKTVLRVGRLAQQMGLRVGENPHFGGVHPVHVNNSYHYKGEAIDVSGSPQQMAAFFKTVKRLFGVQ